MSYYLREIDALSDDDDYDEEEYDEEHEGEEGEYESDVGEEALPQEVEKVDILQLAAEQKKGNKKVVVLPENKSKQKEQQVMTMTEEELNYYQDLKLYGRGQKPKKKEDAVSEEVHFKLNVLQSSKMFFESFRPNTLVIMSGNPKFAAEMVSGRSSNEDTFTVQEISSKHPKFGQLLAPYFDRVDHMTCLSNDKRYLYIYGGKHGKQTPNDFIRYDFSTGKLYVYSNLCNVSFTYAYPVYCVDIPPISNTAMVSFKDTVYIFGGHSQLSTGSEKGQTESIVGWNSFKERKLKADEMRIYAVGNATSVDATGERPIGNGIPIKKDYYTHSKAHPIKDAPSLRCFVSKRTHFSLSQVTNHTNTTCYMFGGKRNVEPNDEMYKYIFVDNSSTFTVEEVKKPSKQEMLKNVSLTWPTPRHSHSQCVVSNFIFIYGGIGLKNQVLNDMFMFDLSTETWTEINYNSIPPPPLSKHASFSLTNQKLFIYGGKTEKGEDSNALYRFNIVDATWEYIEIVSEEMESDNRKHVPCSGHDCVLRDGKIIRTGGLSTRGDPFVRLWNAIDEGKPIGLCDYLKRRRIEGFLCDVAFKLKDKGTTSGDSHSISYVLAHKAILKARCPYLHQKVLESTERMNTSNFNGTFNEDELTCVDFTECTTEMFEHYLNYLYSAEIELFTRDEVESFIAFVQKISPDHHYNFVNIICLNNHLKTLGTTKEILEGLHNDLSNLVNDDTYSDLILMLDESAEVPIYDDCDNELISPINHQDAIEMGGIAVHRLIMARSPFFTRMFVTSGMMEATNKIVHLKDYSRDVMIEVLKYLYTDTIRLSSRNCLGIFVYCIMFDLVDIASCCRRMVVSLLDNSTVWAVFDIATLYGDKILEADCEHYILDRYEELNTSMGLMNLPELTRIKIKQLHEKKTRK